MEWKNTNVSCELKLLCIARLQELNQRLIPAQQCLLTFSTSQKL